MGLTNFPNGITSFGVPQFGPGGLIPVPGDVYWIHPAGALNLGASDGNTGLAPDKARISLSSVQSSMTANQNDSVVLIGNSSAATANTVRESANLDWTKNLTHVIGTGLNRVAHRVSLRNTGTDPTQLFNNSASGCVFANFQVSLSQATAETQIGWDESGERNAYYNIHMGLANSTARQQAGSRDLLITGGGEHYFKDCVIGFDTADSQAMSNLELASQSARNIFEDCYVIMHATDATPNLMELGGTSLNRYVIFKNCMFVNDSTFGGGTELTEAFDIAANCGGMVVMQNSYVYGTALVETATESGVVHAGGGIGTTASIQAVVHTE